MNVHDSGKDEDTISRQDAIDILNEQIKQCDKALDSFDISMRDEYAIKVERASLIAYREQIEALPPAQPKRGKWVVFPVDDRLGRRTGHHLIQCPHCGFRKQIWHSSKMPLFCEGCGSDMREGEQE